METKEESATRQPITEFLPSFAATPKKKRREKVQSKTR